MQGERAGPSAPAAGDASAVGAAAAAGDKPAKVVPYSRRLLLKSLLRAIAIASYSPGGCCVEPSLASAVQHAS